MTGPQWGIPPTPPSLESSLELNGVRISDLNSTSSNNSEFSDSKLIQFQLELKRKGLTEDTIKRYISCIKRGSKESNNCVKAWRNFYRLVLGREPPEGLKVKKTGADLRIPSVEQIKDTLAKVSSNAKLSLFFRLLLESGLREAEVLRVMNEYDATKDVCEGICYYELNWTRGSKGSFYLFHVMPIMRMELKKPYVDKYVKQLGLIPPKYFRKFVSTQMATLGIPFDVIDFIQGRKPTRVLTQHYVSLFGIAREHYKKYAEWVKTDFSQLTGELIQKDVKTSN